LLCSVWTALAARGIAAAERTVTDDQVNAIAKKLNCPVCERAAGRETQACSQWRDLIRQKRGG
jgi:cytochrome c-type biogenesis protein CcmH/NrfF